MINLSNYSCLLWDFDGVLMDSMPVRDEGFRHVLASYPQEQVAELMAYHRVNGGLSRYVKFRYFFEEIRKEPVTEEQVQGMATDFSVVMKRLLINKTLLINDSLDFVRRRYRDVPMHIVSGSDGVELNMICLSLDLAQYFVSIHGSPTPKTQLVREVLAANGYDPKRTVLIGDSINDYQAATANGIDFIGYNNAEFDHNGYNYIRSFSTIP
ncbi:HAD family hydrolase [Dawidia soli]|uniref:phosphoglycolate phosphatase n=1 Tax=Dawidia soli TaxID=2782352 RepID=A0AAP2DCL0_9BACT|nr:HAD hydrolase-like protein [Dawidia soli]MBT1688330.1 HAD hydrolase-like protein [Dawidia soli]